MENFRYGTLEYHFAYICNELSNGFEVFKRIENRELQPCNIPETIKDKPNAKEVFIINYIIAVVLNCVNNKDADILLGAYGFLQGYSDIAGLDERRQKYCDNIGIYDKNTHKYQTLANHWQNNKNEIKSSMFAKENTAVKHLIKELKNKKDHFDFVQIAKESVNKPYPMPNYLKGEGYGYRKCEVNEKIFFVPLTEKERRAAANALPPISSEEESKSTYIINDTLSSEDETAMQYPKPLSFFMRLRRIIIKIKDFIQKNLMTLLITVCILFLIAATRCAWFIGDYFKYKIQMENTKDKTYEHIESIESSEFPDSPINGPDFDAD